MRFGRLIRWLRKASRTNIQTKFAFISLVATFPFFVMVLLGRFLAIQSPILSLILLIIGGGAGICAFGIEHRQLISAVWQNPIGKLVFGLATYLVSSEALIYSDRLIFQYTKLEPTLFPMARNLMTTYIGILAWLRNAWLILLVVHVALLLVYTYQWFLSDVLLLRSKFYRVVRILLNLPKTPRNPPSKIFYVGMSFGLVMMGLVIFIVLKNATSENNMRPFSRWLIVYSSFYPNDGFCRDLPKESKIMLLSNKKEVVHVNYAPDGSEVFSVRPCPKEFNQAVP